MDLFSYPAHPGAKERGGTSEEAANAIRPRAAILRDRVLRLLKAGQDLTADEIATALRESVLSVRPRVTELYRDRLIEKTPLRRKNASGMSATVWRAL